MKYPAKKNRGFSLIELMIAMMLGIIMIGGCLSIFSGVVRSSSLSQTISNLQGNARFALDLIGRDVRAAGFMGCASERDVGLNVNVDNPPTTNLTDSAVSGYVIGESSWVPQLPMEYTAPVSVAAPVAGTHALSVQYARYPGLVLSSSMASTTSDLELQRNGTTLLQDEQLMVLSDCSSAELFSVSSVSRTDETSTVVTNAALAKRYTVSADFADNTRAMPFISTIYYIGDTQRQTLAGDPVYSLYAHSYPYTAANPPTEIVEGVDQLVLEFGIRQTNGSLLYVTADSPAYRDTTVQTVRVGLLLSSLERYASVDESRAYVLAGKSITAKSSSDDENSNDNDSDADSAASEDTADKGQSEDGTAAGQGTGDTDSSSASAGIALTYNSNKRMRIPFNATFNVRNRNL